MATGSALALATSADASVIEWSGIQNLSVTVSPAAGHNHAFLPVKMTGGTQPNVRFSIFNNLRFSSLGPQPLYSAHVSFSAKGFQHYGSIVHSGTSVRRFHHNDAITAGMNFGHGTFSMHHTTGLPTSHGLLRIRPSGPIPIGSAYLGVKLQPSGDLGWIRIRISNSGATPVADTITVIDWAYDTTPGATILAGEGTPEPGTKSMAVLALGAAGIMALRKWRVAKTAA